MKIAIHHRKGSFSERWIYYCEKNNIEFKIVNAYDTDIIEQLKNFDIFIWHHHLNNFTDSITANKILFALENTRVKTFPNFNTTWHFDDKVAQKYLLEAIDAPLVPSFVFYDKNKAKKWAKNTSFPKVFKLKGGASSSNVKLIRSRRQALKTIDKAFGRGISQFDRLGNLKERFRKFKKGKDSLFGLVKGIGRLFIPKEFAKMHGREKGYVYFQEFIPDLNFDIRIQVIGNRIIGLKRYVREGDFRASGSGNVVELNEGNIDIRLLEIALETASKIKSQSLTIDFIYKDDTPLIVELSYCFPIDFYDNCPGYWDASLNWHEKSFNPQEWMIEDLIADANKEE